MRDLEHGKGRFGWTRAHEPEPLPGLGRYTARLIENLTRETSDFEFVVFSYGGGPDTGLLDRGALDKLEWREIPGHERLPYHDLLIDHLAFAKAVRQAGVSFFHGIDHNLSPFLRCPSLVTVHDLIPLVMPGPYLGPRPLLWVLAHGLAARRARFVVTDSDNTRRDVERIWGIPPGRIKVVYAGVDEPHRPIDGERAIEKVREKYRIEKPFFLSTGGFDSRKNIGNALLAFKNIATTGDEGQYQEFKSTDLGGQLQELRDKGELRSGDKVYKYDKKTDTYSYGGKAIFINGYPIVGARFGRIAQGKIWVLTAALTLF